MYKYLLATRSIMVAKNKSFSSIRRRRRRRRLLANKKRFSQRVYAHFTISRTICSRAFCCGAVVTSFVVNHDGTTFNNTTRCCVSFSEFLHVIKKLKNQSFCFFYQYLFGIKNALFDGQYVQFNL
jgi:hypothetical protein